MKIINKWKNLTDEIVEQWICNYFEMKDEDSYSWYWIGDVVGGVLEFSDYFISFEEILKCFELKITKEQYFSWYEDSVSQKTDLSLSDFIFLPEKREEARIKHLEELRERVKTAEKELKKALEKYDTKI